MAAVDPTLKATAGQAGGHIKGHLDQLEKKAVQALKRRETDTGQQLQRLRDALMPGGKLQERVYPVLPYLAKYGVDLIRLAAREDRRPRLGTPTGDHSERRPAGRGTKNVSITGVVTVKVGVTCYPTYGGSGVVATELGKAMAQRQHDVHFISYALPFRLHNYDERIFFHEVEMVSYPLLEHSTYAIALAAKMSEVGSQVGLDLFHVHYAIPHAVSAFLARSILGPQGPRIVTTLHGTDITLVGNDRSLFPMTRFALEQSDGVTCVSRYLLDKTREVFHLDRPMAVIPNFVDTQALQPHSAVHPARASGARAGSGSWSTSPTSDP